MSTNYIIRRPGGYPVPREHQQLTNYTHSAIGAIASVQASAMYVVVDIKRLQGELERFCPDASELLALIANNGSLAIAQRAHRFAMELH